MSRPVMLRLLCADETYSAWGFIRRTVTTQLSFLLSMLLPDIKQNATDRFMRDAICCCNGTERFLLLHHTMHYCRPLF